MLRVLGACPHKVYVIPHTHTYALDGRCLEFSCSCKGAWGLWGIFAGSGLCEFPRALGAFGAN